MYNKVILMGRICNDLELTQTTGGNSVVSFRLAVDRNYQSKGEEKKTDFLNVVAWRTTAEFITKYFSKGRLILLEGEIQTRSYQDKNGATQWVTEIVASQVKFTGEAKKDNNAGAPPVSMPVPPPEEIKRFVESSSNVTNEDYPF